jgi:lysophospholipase L1-like esterase
MFFSSSGVAFNVKARHLEVTFAGDSGTPKTSDNGGLARVAVFVNGERKLDKLLMKAEETFTVFDGSETVSGEVRIIKLSESANSIAGIKAISLDADGTITPASEKALKIEFIGDSITCGYGVDDEDRNHHFSTATEDNTKTYAYKAVQALDADYSMVSVSGWGIVSGYTSGQKNGDSVLPKIYEKTGYTYGNKFNGKQPQTLTWDFTRFVPDFIVINLGTNDHSWTKGDAKKIDQYKKSYVAFLKQIRAKNKDAQIICSLGIMGGDLFPAKEAAVTDYKAETGDEKVSTLKFANQSMADGIAADWHPTEKTHAKAASLLVKKIEALTQK